MLKRFRQAFALPVCEHVPTRYAEARADACEECGSRFTSASARPAATSAAASQYGHARVHYHESGHPVIRAKTAIGNGFIWCYADNRYVGERDSAAA